MEENLGVSQLAPSNLEDELSSSASDILIENKLNRLINSQANEDSETQGSRQAPAKNQEQEGTDVVLRENSELKEQNLLLTNLANEQKEIIFKEEQENSAIKEIIDKNQEKFNIFIEQLQHEYEMEVDNMQKQIDKLNEKIVRLDHSQVKNESSVEVTVARQKQQVELMNQQLLMLQEEIDYKQQLVNLEVDAENKDFIQGINDETLELLQESQQKMLSDKLAMQEQIQQEKSQLLQQSQTMIVNKFRAAETAISREEKRQSPVTLNNQLESVNIEVEEQKQQHLYQQEALRQQQLLSQRIAQLQEQQKQQDRIQQQEEQEEQEWEELEEEEESEYEYEHEEEQLLLTPTPKANHTTEQPLEAQLNTLALQQREQIANVEILEQPSISGEAATSTQEESGGNKQLVRPKSLEQYGRKEVRIDDSPEYEYKEVKTQPMTPRERMERESGTSDNQKVTTLNSNQEPQPAGKQPEQHESRVGALDDDIEEEYLTTSQPVEEETQVPRSSSVNEFNECSNAPINRQIPGVRQATQKFKGTRFQEECKIFDAQFTLAKTLANEFKCAPCEALDRIRSNYDDYLVAIDILQAQGISIMMSEIMILLRVHNIFVRFITADEIESLKKNERMPKPEGRGSEITRLPLMQGKKWIECASLE